MELVALQESLSEIQATGATLVAISPQREPFLRQMTEKNHLGFDLLRDEGNLIAAKFGLVFQLPADLREVYLKFGVDLPRFNGGDSWTLPMPAVCGRPAGCHPKRGCRPGLHGPPGPGPNRRQSEKTLSRRGRALNPAKPQSASIDGNSVSAPCEQRDRLFGRFGTESLA